MARIRKLLIANRGEIAIRVMRTCRRLGIKTAAIYSEADRAAPHVRAADEAYCVGPAPSRDSYLAQERILEVARRARADAIHPGYGFLSENASFARACDSAGVTFIGPPASAMEGMGEKTRARTAMKRAGIPIVPGSTELLRTPEEARAVALQIGYPVMLKAAGGGGGKGMRRVEAAADFDSAWRGAKGEALNAFGNDALYLEKFLDRPRHVEIQVFADSHGGCIHLNERECSAQRRHQKVIEEAPSPIVDQRMRSAMGDLAVKAAKAVGYVGAGTIEFLVENTRLQVEHPVTEWVTGLDLVAWQIKVAEGERLPIDQPLSSSGHAIEGRIYAEDPGEGFIPSPGKIEQLRVPEGPFVRNDSGVERGYVVPSEYDPMIGKLSAWAPTRAEAIARLRGALDEYVVTGITTNIRYLAAILDHPSFLAGDYDTALLTREHQQLLRGVDRPLQEVALLASAVLAYQRDARRARAIAPPSDSPGVSAWRLPTKRRWGRR
jgi:acetyl-CoA carboxylase biotin carboxylase subunit